jgi:hypothetical protein
MTSQKSEIAQKITRKIMAEFGGRGRNFNPLPLDAFFLGLSALLLVLLPFPLIS